LVNGGKVDRLIPDADIDQATGQPPEDTRAYFRGQCIQRYPEAIAAASWDSIIFDTGREVLQRVPLREPLKGTRHHVESLLEVAEDAASLIDALQS
jgi:Pup amidohydrolase